MAGFINHYTWLDGLQYPCQNTSGHFGRVSEIYRGWGELRRQKKSPHTEVLYVLCLQDADHNKPERGKNLVLRSINNCSNTQLQDAIKLAALRLEEGLINQLTAEHILDRCYAEVKRRMDWTDQERRKRGQSQVNQDQAPVERSGI